MPALKDGAGWRILQAVQEIRSRSEVLKVLLDMSLRFDSTGRNAVAAFQEWQEARDPTLGQDRQKRDVQLRQRMDALYRLGPEKVTAIRASSFRSRQYAEMLTQRVR